MLQNSPFSTRPEKIHSLPLSRLRAEGRNSLGVVLFCFSLLISLKYHYSVLPFKSVRGDETAPAVADISLGQRHDSHSSPAFGLFAFSELLHEGVPFQVFTHCFRKDPGAEAVDDGDLRK